MQISSVSGNVSKRTITDIDLNDYLYELDKNKSRAVIATSSTTSNIKTISVGSSRYTRLDSSMPAVAFVNFNTKKGGLFLTNITPPKYIKSFECQRVNNSTGKFTLILQAPIDTFSAGSDDLNIKLINLFGHIDSGTMNDVNGFQCELSYGWRGSSGKSIIKYDNALITGMTVNYSGSYYTYTVVGLINQLSDKSFETGVKILSADALNSIDTSGMSESAVETYGNYTGVDVSGLLDSTGATVTQYKIIIPAGTKIYELDASGKVTATTETTDYDNSMMYSNRRNNTAYWTSDFLYCHGAIMGGNADSKYECYSVSDVIIHEFAGGSVSSDSSTGNEIGRGSAGMDLTTVNSGERISDKVEILANYLYGDLYDIKVAHTDKIYNNTESIATILSHLKNPEATDDDIPSDTTNETTTSLQTWLRQMVKACQDCTESEAYEKYKTYDINNDGILSADDTKDLSSNNQEAIADKWKKYGIDTYSYELTNDADGYASTYTNSAFNSSRKMTEAEFNKYYKDMTTKVTLSNGRVYTRVTGTASYSEYSSDYDKYKTLGDYQTDSAELNELLDSFDGVLYKKATAIQYHMYYIDAAAGTSRGQIYIGPAKTDTDRYQYVVGNKAKHSTVLDFSVSEDLVYLLSAVKSYIAASNSGLYQVDVATGGIIKGVVETSSARIASKEEYATRVANEILSTIATGQCKATLTLISDAESRKIQTTDNISILCQLNGGKSLFSGSYEVTSVKDSIDESGTLKTSMDLQFTQSTAFEKVRDIILTHLNQAASKISS